LHLAKINYSNKQAHSKTPVALCSNNSKFRLSTLQNGSGAVLKQFIPDIKTIYQSNSYNIRDTALGGEAVRQHGFGGGIFHPPASANLLIYKHIKFRSLT
jgi:hypothetical protein